MEALLEGKEADRLPDGPESNIQGTIFGGGVKEPVKAGIEEVQSIQKRGLVGLVLTATLQVKLAGKMPGVAAKGGGAETELGGQGAVGDPGHEAAIYLRAGRVRADGTAFYHTCAPKQEFPHDARLEHRLSQEAMEGQKGWENYQKMQSRGMKVLILWIFMV
jgi:hypothetical protein